MPKSPEEQATDNSEKFTDSPASIVLGLADNLNKCIYQVEGILTSLHLALKDTDVVLSERHSGAVIWTLQDLMKQIDSDAQALGDQARELTGRVSP